MNLLKCMLSVILLLLYMRPNSATDVMSCTECRESNEECGTFCYKVVKHLFQYLRISAEKNDQYEKLQTKLQQRETTIKSLESKANANKEALSNFSEDKLKTEKETLKLQATIHEQQLIVKELEYKELLTNHTKQREQITNVEAQKESLMKSEQLQTKITELQTKLKVQQEALKKSDELISEKDNRIAEIKEQFGYMELLKDELTKQKDRAEATSCVAFGNSNDIQTIRGPGAEGGGQI